ncbi:hypothetical protein N9908_03690 [Akkermansiaceae bacterium]|nr:hypothetical protein [Akkermansiaceae bacterium]MDB4323297.1 hypothetical protein [Akkermansiaceae bacterium]MDB4333580.1 hypothetical protein [Akkermansiaceae bacterium]
MKSTQLLLSGLAGLALSLTACKSASTTDVAPSSDSAPTADSGEMQTVSLNVSGMT